MNPIRLSSSPSTCRYVRPRYFKGKMKNQRTKKGKEMEKERNNKGKQNTKSIIPHSHTLAVP